MKEEISFNRFYDSFEIRRGNFSYGGLKALYDYLIELEGNTGKEIELDVIAICCDFSEYENIKEYLENYSNTHEAKTEDEEEEDFKERIEEEITNKTILIKMGNDLNEGFIIQAY